MVTCSKINTNTVGLFGNKLFIVSTLIGLAKKHNDEVILPGFPTWEYGHCFKHPLKTQQELPQIQHIYSEPFFHYAEIEYLPNLDIRGYYQSEKYFKHAENLVRHYLEPRDEIVEKIKKNYPVVFNERCVSIHVRRGDYLNYPDIHQACGIEYYMNAMEEVKGLVDKYVIFSDDIEWCKGTFVSEKNDVVFVENQSNFEDMFLMSNCQHNIIANSSFSWWGSWMNKNPDKKVVMPKIWFGPKGQPDWQDIYPEGIIKI